MFVQQSVFQCRGPHFGQCCRCSLLAQASARKALDFFQKQAGTINERRLQVTAFLCRFSMR